MISEDQQPLLVPWRALLAALAVALLAALAGERLVDLERETDAQARRQAVLAEASGIRSRIEGEINASVHLALGLAAYVSAKPDLTREDFEAVARALVRSGHHVRNVALAPDNVVLHVYPLQGNEAVVGLEYARHPAQFPAVRRAMESGEPVVAGPIKLVQGGEGLINRVPIYLSDAQGGRGRYWGIASVALDARGLFHAAGLYAPPADLTVALRGRDGEGAQGEVFLGDAALFAGDAVLLDVLVPGGRWQLAVAPAAGWNTPDAQRRAAYLRLAAVVLALVLGGLVYGVLAERQMIRHLALHDSLTRLPNRRLFNDRLQLALARAERAKGRLALLYMDLDGFKEVNDSLGHRAGDRVLVETAQRIATLIRKSDTLARVGGDEFMVILPDCSAVEDAQRTAGKIIAGVREPIGLGGRSAHIGVSIGIAMYPEDGREPDDLVRAADRAMYAAKEVGNSARHLGPQPAAQTGA